MSRITITYDVKTDGRKCSESCQFFFKETMYCNLFNESVGSINDYIIKQRCRRCLAATERNQLISIENDDR